MAWKISEGLGIGIPRQGYSIHQCFRMIRETLSGQDLRLILALDWLGFQIKRHACDLAYLLTRQWDGEGENRISLIALTRDPNLFELFDAPTRSTFMHNKIELKCYSRSQIKNILLDRASLEFKKGTVSEETLDRVSEVASSRGDAGLAIRLLRRAEDIANSEKAKRVTCDHVEKAKALIHPHVWEEEIEALGTHERLIFTALKRKLEHSVMDFVLTGELAEEYVKVCVQLGIRPLSNERFRKLLREMSFFGFVEVNPFRVEQNGATSKIQVPKIVAH